MDQTPLTEDQLDALLAERDPIDVARLDGRDLDRSLEALFAIAPRRRSGSRRGNARRFPTTRLAIGFGLAATGAAAASLIGFNVFGAGGPSLEVQLPAAQADAELDRIAVATAGGPQASARQWLYLELRGTQRDNYILNLTPHPPVMSFRVKETEQIWTASAQGPTRIRLTLSGFSFLGRSRELYLRHRREFSAEIAPLPLAPGRTATVDVQLRRNAMIGAEYDPTAIGNNARLALSSLPRDPRALVRLLGHNQVEGMQWNVHTAAQRESERQTTAADEALGEWIGLKQILIVSTSASQRAEAYRALSLVRFVHVERSTAASAPIEIRFSLGGPNHPETLTVDAATGDLLRDTSGSWSTNWAPRAVVSSEIRLPDGHAQPEPPRTSRDGLLTIAHAVQGTGFLG